MKHVAFAMMTVALLTGTQHLFAQTKVNPGKPVHQNLYIDVHQLEPGKVSLADVAAAHKKDLAIEKNYGVQFKKFWVNEEEGLVYCLSSAPDTMAIRKTHQAAHGLLPAHTFQVSSGAAAGIKDPRHLRLDIHQLGAGKVKAADVAAAHQKDLAVQKKHGVRFINYWVDEKEGTVFCLSEAMSSDSVLATHKEAHGLLPASIVIVKQGE